MLDVVITAAVIVAAGCIGYAIGKQVGREEAVAEIRGRCRLVKTAGD